MALLTVLTIEEMQKEYLLQFCCYANCRLVCNKRSVSLLLGIQVINKKGAYSKINHKNAKKNPVKSFIFMRNLPCYFATVQCRPVLRNWCYNPKEIEGKNCCLFSWSVIDKSLLRLFSCKNRTWTSLTKKSISEKCHILN